MSELHGTWRGKNLKCTGRRRLSKISATSCLQMQMREKWEGAPSFGCDGCHMTTGMEELSEVMRRK